MSFYFLQFRQDSISQSRSLRNSATSEVNIGKHCRVEECIRVRVPENLPLLVHYFLFRLQCFGNIALEYI